MTPTFTRNASEPPTRSRPRTRQARSPITIRSSAPITSTTGSAAAAGSGDGGTGVDAGGSRCAGAGIGAGPAPIHVAERTSALSASTASEASPAKVAASTPRGSTTRKHPTPAVPNRSANTDAVSSPSGRECANSTRVAPTSMSAPLSVSTGSGPAAVIVWSKPACHHTNASNNDPATSTSDAPSAVGFQTAAGSGSDSTAGVPRSSRARAIR